jgi:hypothetical protein
MTEAQLRRIVESLRPTEMRSGPRPEIFTRNKVQNEKWLAKQ